MEDTPTGADVVTTYEGTIEYQAPKSGQSPPSTARSPAASASSAHGGVCGGCVTRAATCGARSAIGAEERTARRPAGLASCGPARPGSTLAAGVRDYPLLGSLEVLEGDRAVALGGGRCRAACWRCWWSARIAPSRLAA